MGFNITKKKFLILFTLIVIIAFFMRIYLLTAKPMHHDEGILEYYYVKPLLDNYALDYLGTEYHGLAFHYLTYPFTLIFGSTILAIRLSAAVFGTLSVVLLYFLKDYIGKVGVLFSAAFLAISPFFVYYSRQYTGYPFYIFFLLLLIILWLKYFKEFKSYLLYLIGITLAIILNINEIFFTFLLISVAFYYLTALLNKNIIDKPLLKKIKWKHVAIAICIFLFFFVVIHSNFFFKWGNMGKLLDAFSHVAKKTVSTGHNKSVTYYLTKLIPMEIGILITALLGIFFFKKDNFSRFLVFWSLASIFLFSLISYKTNWMIPVVTLPLILQFGNAMDYLTERFRLKWIISIAGILLISLSLFYSVQQNFIYFNDFKNNKVGYVETSTEVYRLEQDVNNYAKGSQLRILLTAKGYWPLPYYLRGHKISYFTNIKKLNFTKYDDYDIYISDKSQIPVIPKNMFKEEYLVRKGYNVFVLYNWGD